MKQYLSSLLAVWLVGSSLIAMGQSASDSTKMKKLDESLPLQPERTIAFNSKQGTWISVDVSPDGKTGSYKKVGEQGNVEVDLVYGKRTLKPDAPASSIRSL